MSTDTARPTIRTFWHYGGYPLSADRPAGWYYVKVWEDRLEGPFGPYETEQAARARFESLESWLKRELAAADARPAPPSEREGAER